MSRKIKDVVNWTEEHLELRLNETAQAHHAVGFSDSAAMLREEAMLAFARGEDSIALFAREFAKKLQAQHDLRRKMQREAREQIDKLYPHDNYRHNVSEL